MPPPWPSGPLTDLRIVCPLCAMWWGCQHPGGAHTAPGGAAPPWADRGSCCGRGAPQGYDIPLVGFASQPLPAAPLVPACAFSSPTLRGGLGVRLHLVEAAGWGLRMRCSGALEALLPPDSVPKPHGMYRPSCWPLTCSLSTLTSNRLDLPVLSSLSREKNTPSSFCFHKPHAAGPSAKCQFGTLFPWSSAKCLCPNSTASCLPRV